LGRTARDNRDVPHLQPVERIELSEEHTKLRFVIAIVLAMIGIGLLVYTAFSHLAVQTGWETIEVSSSAEMNCSQDFVFQYNLGGGGVSASAEKRALMSVYTDATVHAYRLFQNDNAIAGLHNIFYINHHPNEEIVVDETLYKAFSLIQDAGNRQIYLAPIFGQYDNLFSSKNDSEAYNFDPYQNAELAEWYGEVAAFARNTNDVNIELLGDCTIRLFVSEAYLKYAEENWIDTYIDFYWMKNAFIIDYLAEELRANGYTRGNLSSYDGFVRNLDESEETYEFRLYDRWNNTVYNAATMQYLGERSIVYLRDYQMNSLDFQHYYETESGEIRFPYLDISDGFGRSSLHNIVAYSKDKGCSEILLEIMPLFISDRFEEASLKGLTKKDVYAIWFTDGVLHYTDAELTLSDLYDRDNIVYSKVLVK